MRTIFILLDENGIVLDANLASLAFIIADSTQVLSTAIWKIPGNLNSHNTVNKLKNVVSQGVECVASRFEALHTGDAR